MVDGTYNNVTGAKQNVSGATLVMAASSSTAGTARLAWVDPRGPVATAGLTATSVGTAASGTLQGSSPTGGALMFEVLAAPSSGTVTITNPATGAFTYTPAAGFVGADAFTFRVRAAAPGPTPPRSPSGSRPSPVRGEPGSSTRARASSPRTPRAGATRAPSPVGRAGSPGSRARPSGSTVRPDGSSCPTPPASTSRPR
ncbi:Ig-like domain-containing protein [Oerskovia sp. M15]